MKVSPDPKQDALLRAVAEKLGLSPEAVAQAVTEGRSSALLDHLPPQEAAKLRPLLVNPDAAAQIIASPQAQALLKKWFRNTDA